MTREARWAGVVEVLNFAENHVRRSPEPSLDGFLEELALTSGDEPSEEPERPKDAVALMTLHAAKGLEFPHVFVVGVEEGILPHRNYLGEHGDASGPDGAAVEEERRLAYVGITRARETLTLSCADTRRRGGEVVTCEPSRFLKELPAEDVFWEGRDMPQDPQTAQERADAHLGQLRALLGSG
jgi:ATP-dependent DNA helicase Rep